MNEPDNPAPKMVICDHADQDKCKLCRFRHKTEPVKGYPLTEFCSLANCFVNMVEEEP